MEIYVNPISKMGQTGSTLLKLIQNTTLPVVDLIVREGLQNSLDAARADTKSVRANFIIGSCQRSKVDKIFTGITGALREAILGENMDFLALQDFGTTGLTGPLKEEEYTDGSDRGNLRKLIYEICQAQTGADKGGSWGLGKTVFFRAGIGIVMYYSRIKKDNGYEERMAATLIENEKDDHSLLCRAKLKKGKLFAGVAWWGQKDAAETDTWPLTDIEEIHAILDTFGISPYTEEETGTTVIVPYIDKEKLCANANTAGKNSVLSKWTLENFIAMAVQRWYLPRLYNKSYSYGPWLDFRLNGKKYRAGDLEPFFVILQELYNNAAKDGKEIRVNSVFEGNEKFAGWLNIRKITREDLGHLNPHLLINKAEEGENEDVPPIVAFCRKAGMVINYDTDGAWTARVPHSRKGEYVVAFFVLNSDIKLSGTNGITLDNYVRSAENADHMNWYDRSIGDRPCTIVSRIQKNAAKKLLEEIRPQEPTGELKSDNRLQRRLGELLLPPKGFGNRPKAMPKGGASNASHKGGTHGLDMREMQVQYLGKNRLALSWKVVLNKYYKNIVQELSVSTATGAVIHALEWESAKKGIGTIFPFAIEKVQVACKDKMLDCQLIKSEEGAFYAFEADTSILRPSSRSKKELCCQIWVHCLDESLTCCISLQEDGK